MALGDYSIGSTGSGVSDLQRYLNSVGLAVGVDGVYGPATANAVRSFQSARGIAVDGIAGPETLVELSSAISEGWTIGYAQPPSDAASPVPFTVGPSHVPGATLVPSGAPASGSPKIPPIVIIGGVLLLLWYFNSKRSKAPSAPRFALHQDDFEPDADDEPEEDEDEDDDEGEED